MVSPQTPLRGQRVALVGFGKESVALARFAAHQGATAISVTDRQSAEQLAPMLAEVADLPVEVQLFAGANDPRAWEDADVIFVSPGISPGFQIKVPGIAEAAARGAIVTNHTQLFFERCPAPIIGITGSAGKTTTTTLVAEMLRAEGHRRIFLGGNMGIPLINEIGTITADDLVVLEISEVQLARLHASPHIGVITNVAPDHLDRYGTFDEYIRAKRQIVRAMTAGDFAVLNLENEPSRGSAAETRAQVLYFSRTQPVVAGADIRAGDFWLHLPGGREERICGVAEMQLIGPHNEANILAAATAAALAGASAGAIAQVVRQFGGVPHRIQFIAERRGVRYYSDSIATSPTRMQAGLRAFDVPVLLIAGGKDKDLPWEEGAEEIVRRARVVAVLGVSAPKILAAIAAAQARLPVTEQRLSVIQRVGTIEEAVTALAGVAQPGEVVLLSPGCTSHDMFHGYEERGQHFIDTVLALPD